jgi:ElaB/YqjD/DUF883 family membrane-anchored ribosome-binding protein
MNTNDDDFIEDDPLAAPRRSARGRGSSRARARLSQAGHRASNAGSEAWQQARVKAGLTRRRTETFLRENPVPMILGALAAGLAIGLAIRYSSSSSQKEVESRPSLAGVDWSVLSLPFLWPFFRSLKERCLDSAEAVKEGVDRVKEIDIHRYTKPIKKRWKSWTG